METSSGLLYKPERLGVSRGTRAANLKVAPGCVHSHFPTDYNNCNNQQVLCWFIVLGFVLLLTDNIKVSVPLIYHKVIGFSVAHIDTNSIARGGVKRQPLWIPLILSA